MSPDPRYTQKSRLPASGNVTNRGAAIAKGVFALIGSSIIAIGVPAGLLLAFGTPWPSTTPSLEWLTQPTTSETLVAILATVVWLAWAHFILCVIVEAVAEIRQRGMAIHIPGGGIGTQYLARRLIATVVLVAGTAGAGISTASAATTGTADESSSAIAANAVGDTGADSILDSAHVLGTNIGELGSLNQTGHVDIHPDAAATDALPSPSQLSEANTADNQAGAVTYYDVKPPNGRHYDTLWDIAERYLGDGLRYKEIWELNKDVSQPDGRILRNADLIYPGWVMKMPADAKGPGLKVIDHAEPSAPTDTLPSLTHDGPNTATTPANAPAAHDGADAATAKVESTGNGLAAALEPWGPLFGVAGGLAFAGAFLTLRRKRNSSTARQLWANRSLATAGGFDPRDPDDTPPPNGGAQLSNEVDTPTAAWLNRALRQLRGAPAPARASVSAAGVAIVFDHEPLVPPPAGWTSASNKLWSLDRGIEPEETYGPSAVPGLVSVGRRDDDRIQLIDIEAAPGIVSLDGDDAGAHGLALSIAVDSATHPWADNRVVTMVNFATDLTAVGAGAIRHVDDLAAVMDGLDNVAHYQRELCAAAGTQTAREARAARSAQDWTYHLIVCSGVPEQNVVQRLNELSADPRLSLGVVVLGSVTDPAMRLTARPDGSVASPLHGIDVNGQRLSVDAAHQLVELFEPSSRARSVSLTQLIDVLHVDMSLASWPNADPSAPIPQEAAHISMLGSLNVEAPGPVESKRRALLSEIACFIGLHPGGVHVNRISAAIWPRGVETSVLANTMDQLRRWFTSTADEEPLIYEDAGVWSFRCGSVAIDWQIFRGALNSAAEEGEARDTHLRAALALVRGPAFDGARDSGFSWLESMTVTSDMALAVSLTAQSLAESAMARKDEAAARSALESGLGMLPANEELWRSMLRLDQHFGDRVQIEQTVHRMYSAINAFGSQLGAEPATDALVADLLPGFHQKAA